MPAADWPTVFDGAIEADLAASERIRTIVDDVPPSGGLGDVVIILADGPAPRPSPAAVDAAIAIEYAYLHRYIHAITAASGGLTEPAATSPYPDDAVHAILDGDALQSSAFSRLTRATDDPTVAMRWCDRLAGASVATYERWVETDPRSSSSVAPLAGLAVRLGSALRGHEGDVLDEAANRGATLGARLRFDLPTGPSRPAAGRPVAAIESLVEMVVSGDVRDAIQAELEAALAPIVPSP